MEEFADAEASLMCWWSWWLLNANGGVPMLRRWWFMIYEDHAQVEVLLAFECCALLLYMALLGLSMTCVY